MSTAGGGDRVGDGDDGVDVLADAGELAQRVPAGDEEAGVDRASNVRRRVDLGDDGDAAHVLHVSQGEAAAGLAQYDDAVRVDLAVHDAAQSEVAGAAQGDEQQTRRPLVQLVETLRVNHRDRRGARRGLDEREAVGDVHRHVRVTCCAEAEQRGRAPDVAGHGFGESDSRREQRDRSRDRARAAPASGTDDRDGLCSHR